jgi:phage terminase Nu1 subunit (DNA packaging protein)
MTVEDFDFEGEAPDADSIPVYGLNKRQLAAAFNVSLKTINRWCLEGLPSRSSGSRKGGLRFDLPAAIEWRRAADLAEQGGDGESLADAKRRNAIAQAYARELANAEREGRLIEMESVRAIINDVYGDVRERIITLSGRVPTLDPGQRDQIDAAANDVLAELADRQRKLGITAEEPSKAEFG